MGDLGRIRTNITALKAYKNLSDINSRILKASERLSSGKLLTSAADSPSSWYISRVMQLDIDRLKRLQKNLERGINWLQTNDARYTQVIDILQEMNDIAAQARSGGISSVERGGLQIALKGFLEQITDILASGVSSTLYSGFSLGYLDNVSLTGTSVPTLSSLGLTNISVTGTTGHPQTTANIDNTLNVIEAAMRRLLQDEVKMGSWMHRLTFQMEETGINEVNARASLSTIEDADLAFEQVEMTKLQILQQTALAMLTQANLAPQALLRLFNI